jgi:glycosyltransferase involved in cell wall biosynthesis
MTLSILFVHQGYELYGSDRMLLQSVQAVALRWPEARITVLLPRDGALRAALLPFVADIRIIDLAILRKSNLKKMRLGDIKGLIGRVRAARRSMLTCDVTYINTVMVMDYVLAACVVRRPRVIHVHELPTGFAAAFFSTLLTLSRAYLIFNSHATRCSFAVPPWQRSAIVWNGTSALPESKDAAPHASLNLLMIGRFNAWKGQEVLLRAVAELPTELRMKVKVKLVGGVFGAQTYFTDRLASVISELDLSNIVEMFPFTSEPAPHYAWADVMVVPSTKPEPFGLVAIEGMAAGCCVIASNHGGISEIVIDGLTGSLVAPGSIESLTAAITRYVEDPPRAQREGIAGRQRFAAEFDERQYKSKITRIIADLCKLKMA